MPPSAWVITVAAANNAVAAPPVMVKCANAARAELLGESAVGRCSAVSAELLCCTRGRKRKKETCVRCSDVTSVTAADVCVCQRYGPGTREKAVGLNAAVVLPYPTARNQLAVPNLQISQFRLKNQKHIGTGCERTIHQLFSGSYVYACATPPTIIPSQS